MSALLEFDRISAARPDGALLFSDLTLALGAERVGLVGRNGTGKSTLLAIAEGSRAPEAGTVVRRGTIGMLRQIPVADGTVASALGVADVLDAIARLEAGLGSETDAALADWEMPGRIGSALDQAGLPALDPSRDASGLSGGERTRLAIARLLLDAPQVLLLDEPTNNLDSAGRAAVEALLERWNGAALIASHDRALLERMDRIVHLSPVEVTVHGGGWSEFRAAREAARDVAMAELDRARREAGRQRSDAQDRAEKQARRDRAGRATRARGDMPKILLGARKQRAENTAGAHRALAERQEANARAMVEAAQRRVEVVTPLSFVLPPSQLPANRTVLHMADVVVERGGRALFAPLSVTIVGPERVAIAGPNGAGKTSLIRVATGDLGPVTGTVSRQRGRVALLDQHVGLLDPRLSLMENMRAHHPDMTAHQAHEAAARFAFRNREALRPVATMSGGERLRAGLAVAFAGPEVPQLLILDEPTNHLDVESIEELEAALAAYDGAVLVVSHDDAFLEAVGVTRTITLG